MCSIDVVHRKRRLARSADAVRCSCFAPCRLALLVQRLMDSRTREVAAKDEELQRIKAEFKALQVWLRRRLAAWSKHVVQRRSPSLKWGAMAQSGVEPFMDVSSCSPGVLPMSVGA